MLDIEAIRRRAEKATAGPWTIEMDGDSDDYRTWEWPAHIRANDGGYGRNHHICNLQEDFTNDDDAVFIAHARTDVPILCDEVERLRVEVARLTGLCLPRYQGNAGEDGPCSGLAGCSCSPMSDDGCEVADPTPITYADLLAGWAR